MVKTGVVAVSESGRIDALVKQKRREIFPWEGSCGLFQHGHLQHISTPISLRQTCLAATVKRLAADGAAQLRRYLAPCAEENDPGRSQPQAAEIGSGVVWCEHVEMTGIHLHLAVLAVYEKLSLVFTGRHKRRVFAS